MEIKLNHGEVATLDNLRTIEIRSYDLHILKSQCGKSRQNIRKYTRALGFRNICILCIYSHDYTCYTEFHPNYKSALIRKKNYGNCS